MPFFYDTTPFTLGVMDAAEVNGIFDEIERYVNGGIEDNDVSWSGLSQRWIQPRHIFKPEFYGSPDPRIEATSGTVHYRFTPLGRLDWSVHHGLTRSGTDSGYAIGGPAAMVPGVTEASPWDISAKDWQHSTGRWQRQRLWPNHGDGHPGQWETIRGMGVTVLNDGGPAAWEGTKESLETNERDCIVTASCSAREGGSFDQANAATQVDSDDEEKIPYTSYGGLQEAHGPELVECARLALFVDGSLVGNTVRRIFTSRGQKWVNKNFMWVEHFTLEPGIHSIEVRIKVLQRFQPFHDPPDRWKHIFVDSRSMVVDLQSFREKNFWGMPGRDTNEKEPALVWP